MIAQLRGTIMLIDNAGIVIDVAGVGYAVTVSGKTRAGPARVLPDLSLIHI